MLSSNTSGQHITQANRSSRESFSFTYSTFLRSLRAPDRRTAPRFRDPTRSLQFVPSLSRLLVGQSQSEPARYTRHPYHQRTGRWLLPAGIVRDPIRDHPRVHGHPGGLRAYGCCPGIPCRSTGARAWIAAGVTAVTFFGVLRLIVLGIVARARPDWIELFHVYIMELATLAFAMFVFIYWIEDMCGDPV